MSIVLSQDFFNLEYPVAALTSACGLPSQEIITKTINMVWDFCQDHYWNGVRYNLPAAFHEAQAHLKECARLFEKYESGYQFTDLERLTALSAWLAPKGIDPWEKDEYWKELGPDVFFILTQ